MRVLTFFALLLGGALQLAAQDAGQYWKQISVQSLPVAESVNRPNTPTEFATFQLDFAAIKAVLKQAPREWTPAAESAPLHISLPNADGTLDTYAVVESPLLTEGDQKKYPDIKTYTGYSLTTPGKVTRFAHTMLGFNGITITAERKVELIEVYTHGQTEYYQVFDWNKVPESGQLKPVCGSEDSGTLLHLPTERGAADRSGAAELVKLKLYRFACATTGEFSQNHGGTKASVMAAMTNYMNALNAIYEFEVYTRMIFVDNTDTIFFLDPNTDPYSGVTVHDWAAQNPAAMNTAIGFNSYDVGHVFARYISGTATGVAAGRCCTQGKGQACSAGNGNGSYGTDFLKTIGHEIGHQWSAGHTWNFCDSPAAQDQYAAGSAFEPGSGTTIMSYAGACGSSNVGGNTYENYYHSGSFDQIRNFIENGSGATCGTEQLTTNHHPVVTLPYTNGFYIPISTPFELIGQADDQDGDVLTYTWEGMNLGPLTPLGQQQGTSPLFRSLPPSTSGNRRVFPNIQAVVQNQIPPAELLPIYSRDIKLRLTARDNKPGGGGIGQGDVQFFSTDQAGPFKVLSPNTLTEEFTSGACAKVTWDVANTDNSLVNCKKVNIRLSTNGGFSYPITLASNEPNDGVAYVSIPNNTTSNTARIRVEAADNIFFDISNSNFRILAPTTPSFALCMGDDVEQICLPAKFSTSFTAGSLLGFSGSINLAVTSGLPTGAVATFSKNEISPGETSNLDIDLTGVTQEGVYNVEVTATSGAQTEVRNIKLVVYSNVFTDFKPLTPTNGASGQSQTPQLTWQNVPDANTYEIELANNPSFAAGTIIASKQDVTGGSFAVPVLLQKGKTYYWRVRPVNECGKHDWSETFVFATVNEACSALSATDLPKNISTGSNVTVSSSIFLSGGAVSDVNVKKVGIFHDFFKDLTFSLIHPDGTTVLLSANKCGNSSGNFIFGFDDAAPNTLLCPPGNVGTAYRPENPLAALNGKDAQGIWKLEVKDGAPGGGGGLQAFEIEVCGALTVNAPVIVNNNILQVQGGANALITDALLKAEDPDDGPANLRFVLISGTKYGVLDKDAVTLGPGATFTQQDINDGKLRYFHHGWSGLTDAFKFIVEDGRGGMVGVAEFQIQPLNVSTDDLSDFVEFKLMPVPVQQLLTIQLGSSVDQDLTAQILSIDGRLVSSSRIGAGTTSAQLQVGHLSSGMYFLRLTDGVRQSVGKFVKE